jgi:anti-sigma factor RsiW
MIDETHTSADPELLAYIDGVLSPAERQALEARLDGDPALKARLAELAAGGRPFAGAYDLLLRNAPRERLAGAPERARATFAATQQVVAPPRAGRKWLAPLAAAVVLFLAGAAVGVGFTNLLPEGEIAGDDESEASTDGWRAAVAEYLTLYTRDTLANLSDDKSQHEAELKSVGDKLALSLSVDKVTLAGLALKRSQIFDLDGRPLAQIAYLAPGDGPVAFCIIADAAKDRELSFEERRGKNIVYWSKGGHAFLLIGNLARSTLETLAASLAARVA